MPTKVRSSGRRLRPGELPRVYLSMRTWDPATKKMRHIRGANIIIANYTPWRVKEVIVQAFRADVEAQKRKRDLEIGRVVGHYGE